MKKRKKLKSKTAIFDLLLTHILAWGAAGFDVTEEIKAARILADLMTGGVQ